jgi:hypothetical protein
MMSGAATREELSLTVDTAQWGWLRPHLERGGIIVVSPDLDLVEAGFGISSNDTTMVSEWIDTGRVAKPSATQIFDWDAEPDTPFRILIASPYVLVQPLSPLVS